MASLSLYRKWRPQSFKEVVGQNHIKTTLQNAIKSSRISHAYLFTGPRGIGKTSVARILAKAVNCKNPKDGEPCNKCEHCEDISSGKSLDLIEIDAASNRGIDEIRELREKIKFTPHNNKYKVFIIDEVHMLTKEAFNALLKTLEEPPPHAIFALATTEAHKVPSTVLSRCQRFNFSKISTPQLVLHLEKIIKEEKIKASENTLRMIASYSEGSARDAISILDQVSSFGNKNVTEELVENILGVANIKIVEKLLEYLIFGKTDKFLEEVNNTMEEGIDVSILIDNIIERARDLLFIKVGNLENFVKYSKEELEKFKDLALKTEIARLIEIIEKLSVAKQKVKFSMPNHLPLELLALETEKPESNEEKTTNAESANAETAKESAKDAKGANAEDASAQGRSARGGEESAEVSTDKLKEKQKSTEKNSKSSIKKSKDKKELFLKIKENWDNILKKLKPYNHSLVVCLKSAYPERIENGYLLLEFDYSFHKDKIQSTGNKRIVEDAIKDIIGEFIPIRCSINPKKKTKESSVLDNAAKILGGEIIE